MTQNFGSGGSPSAVVNNIGANKFAITTSWTRYSIVISVPSISGKTIGSTANTSSLYLSIWASAGSDWNNRTDSLGNQNITLDFWGVQVEAGSVATAFQTATGTIQGELAACQRYYNNLGTVGHTAYSADGVMGFVFPVTMRATPTASFSYSGVTNRMYNIQTGVTSTLSSPTVIVTKTGVNNLYAFSPSSWAVSAGTGFHTQWTLEAEL
jgi:hypothetical protein